MYGRFITIRELNSSFLFIKPVFIIINNDYSDKNYFLIIDLPYDQTENIFYVIIQFS